MADEHESYDLTTSEAAKFLKVHERTLRRWTEDNKVPHWKTPGGTARYRRSDLLGLLPREPAS